MMKNFKLFLFSFVLIAGFLTACTNNESVVEDQNIDESEAIITSLNRLAQHYNDDGYVIASANPSGNIVFDYCFDFVYPLNLSYNNGTTVSVSSLDDLITVLINSNDNLYINGVEFPFNVETYNQDTDSIEVVTINNEDEFLDLLEDCDFDSNEQCNCDDEYAPVCVEIQAPDGQDFILTYPNACYAMCDGFTPDDFVENCTGDGNNTGGFECFDFNFPLTIITDDQQTITVNSQLELDNALYNTYYFDFVYPFSVTLTNGVTATVGNEDDLIDLLEDCFDDCPCPSDVNPVCVAVETDSGGIEIITFLNACEAECQGFSSNDFVNCEDTNPNDCSEQDVFTFLLECNWYINTSLFDNVVAQYAQFSQDGSLQIFSEGSNDGINGTWELASNTTLGDVYMYFNITSSPFDIVSQLDWTVTQCSADYILLESGNEFIMLERDCVNNVSDCTDEVNTLLTQCSWSIGDYVYIFNSDGSLTISGGGITTTGVWFIGTTSPTSIFIQTDMNDFNDEWIFEGCDENEFLEIRSSVNPNNIIVTDCD